MDCAICLNRFTLPVVLPCGHTFDRQCLAEKKECSLCRQHYVSPPPLNYSLAEVMELKIPEGHTLKRKKVEEVRALLDDQRGKGAAYAAEWIEKTAKTACQRDGSTSR